MKQTISSPLYYSQDSVYNYHLSLGIRSIDLKHSLEEEELPISWKGFVLSADWYNRVCFKNILPFANRSRTGSDHTLQVTEDVEITIRRAKNLMVSDRSHNTDVANTSKAKTIQKRFHGDVSISVGVGLLISNLKGGKWLWYVAHPNKMGILKDWAINNG